MRLLSLENLTSLRLPEMSTEDGTGTSIMDGQRLRDGFDELLAGQKISVDSIGRRGDGSIASEDNAEGT